MTNWASSVCHHQCTSAHQCRLSTLRKDFHSLKDTGSKPIQKLLSNSRFAGFQIWPWVLCFSEMWLIWGMQMWMWIIWSGWGIGRNIEQWYWEILSHYINEYSLGLNFYFFYIFNSPDFAPSARVTHASNAHARTLGACALVGWVKTSQINARTNGQCNSRRRMKTRMANGWGDPTARWNNM